MTQSVCTGIGKPLIAPMNCLNGTTMRQLPLRHCTGFLLPHQMQASFICQLHIRTTMLLLLRIVFQQLLCIQCSMFWLAPGTVILTTIPENAPFLKQLLGVEPQHFRPAIPHLVSNCWLQS